MAIFHPVKDGRFLVSYWKVNGYRFENGEGTVEVGGYLGRTHRHFNSLPRQKKYFKVNAGESPDLPTLYSHVMALPFFEGHGGEA